GTWTGPAPGGRGRRRRRSSRRSRWWGKCSWEWTSSLGELELLAGRDDVGVGQGVEGGDLPPAGAVAELGGGDGPEGVAGADGVRAAVAAARPGRRVLEALGDAAADAPHGHAARVDLPGLPFGVADHRGVAVLAPAVRAQDRGRRADHGLDLHVRPRVLAVAEVLALEAVEVPVAVGVGLVVGGQVPLGDHGAEHVVVAQARVVGAAVADQVHAAVLGDDA